MGSYGGGGAVRSAGVASTRTVGASASIFFLCSTKKSSIIGLDPMGAPTCLHKQEVEKPSLNAAQPYAKAKGCTHHVHHDVHDAYSLPGLINCGKAGPLGSVPGILTH